jgi:hypothetical protein
MRIIVTGLIAQYPLGGMAWHYLQYVLGLHYMGHEVFYMEDSGQCPYNPELMGLSKNCGFNVRYLNSVFSRYGLENKWAYKSFWDSKWYGLGNKARNDVVNSAELLINISGSLATPADYRVISRLAYIDTDPVFTQIKLARGQRDFEKLILLHDVLFSFGERISTSIFEAGLGWAATRQPICISEWGGDGSSNGRFTTIMNWTSYKPIKYKGDLYGQKDIEFAHFMDLPRSVPGVQLELAINAGKTRRTPKNLLQSKGWILADPDEVCPDMDSYRDYILNSKAEWSVAKNAYVTGNSGWFSERSACYLAAGKPVVVQDTGFSDVLPVGEGILAFTSMEEAVKRIREVENNYEQHSRAARAIAEEYFDSDKVLSALLEEAMNLAPAVSAKSGKVP